MTGGLQLPWLRGAKRSAFLRAVGALMGGNAVAAAVPILAAPVLGRLYAPADYGALAQYMAPAAVLGVLACLQFQNAVIVERTDRGAGAAAWLGLLSTLITSAVTALAVAVLWVPVLAGSAPGAWFTLLPLSVAGAGLVATGQFLATRHRMYRRVALVQVAQVLATVALSIVLGLLDWGSNGLLAAYVLGQTVQISAYAGILARLRVTLGWPGAARLRVLVRRHWRFPLFTLPSEFSGQINLQAPVIALTVLQVDATLGAFTRARQLVSMPVTVVGQSVAQVFRREASELYQETGSCREIMRRTAGWLFTAGLGPCLLFMIFAPWLFAVYLGPDWHEAGEIARILAPMLLLRAIVSPLTTVFYFTGNQALDLKLMLGSVALIALAICLGWAIAGTAIAVIWAFALGYGIVYLVYLITTFKVAGP